MLYIYFHFNQPYSKHTMQINYLKKTKLDDSNSCFCLYSSISIVILLKMCILTITHKPNQQRFVIPSYDIFPILTFTSILTCPVVTSSTRRVWPIHRGFLHLLGIWSHLYIFRGPCLLCFEFVFRYTGFWDCRHIVIFIFHWLNFNNKRWATITTDNI